MSIQEKEKWFFSTILERKRLNHPSSQKETYHIALDLADSDIEYEVGDCIKIVPHNDSDDVETILRILGLGGHEIVYDKSDAEYRIEHYLLTRANIHKITKKAFTTIVKASDLEKQPALLLPENSEALKEHLSTLTLLALVKEYRPTLSAEQLTFLLLPLMPRYYSIASSMHEVNKQAHLTVARVGVASDYLCKHAKIEDAKIQIAHHKSPHFGLPEKSHDKPIIMVGPGTGIAPFRGFLQERVARGACADNWLFFGERSCREDFYYQEYLEGLQAKGMLQLDTAFSRDSAAKVYVQHKMYEKRKELWHWLDKKGAYFFVCGDKKNMAKSVDDVLLQIVSEEGKMSPVEAKAYLSRLRKEKRIMRDVY